MFLSPFYLKDWGYEIIMSGNIFLNKIREYGKIYNKDKSSFYYLEKGIIRSKMSYLELYNYIKSYSSKFKNLNLCNKLCLLYLPAGVEAVGLIFGCLSAGIIPIIRTIGEDVAYEKLSYHISEIKKEIPEIFALITNYEYKNLDTICRKNSIEYININHIDKLKKYNPTKKFINADIVLLTSGSTKFSKGIKITLDQLYKNALYCKKIWNVDENSRCLTWMPHSHIYGLVSGILVPIITGSQSFIMSPKEFSNHCEIWLENLSSYKITHTHTAASNLTLENSVVMHKKKNLKKLDLSNLKTLSLGGEMVNIKLLEKFNDYFSSMELNKMVYSPNCGMTEISGLLCGVENSDEIYTLKVNEEQLKLNNRIELQSDFGFCELVSVGKVETANVLIMIPNTNTILSEKNIGEIIISIDSISNGYIKEEDNINVFVKFPFIDNRTYYRTGDLGFVYNKHLFITGRIKELIKIKGKNISPYEIESCINLFIKDENLGDNVAFSVKDEFGKENIGIFIEIHNSINYTEEFELKEQIVEIIKNKLQIVVNKDYIVFLNKNKIPRFTNGKISRKKCNENFQLIRSDESG